MPERAFYEISQLVKERILEGNAHLECMNCHNIWYEKIAELPEHMKCPVCAGVVITYLQGNETEQEKQRIAGLVTAYGRRAIIALSARGVGPEFASRILKRLHKGEDELIKDLIDAERTFARTHRYWG
jgi:ATP-dependent Lhr-like helicase